MLTFAFRARAVKTKVDCAMGNLHFVRFILSACFMRTNVKVHEKNKINVRISYIQRCFCSASQFCLFRSFLGIARFYTQIVFIVVNCEHFFLLSSFLFDAFFSRAYDKVK